MSDQHARVEAIGLIDGLRAEHSRYKDLVSLLPISKLRLQEDSRRYLCLRCAGFLEQMVFLTVRAFLAKKSSGPSLEFSNSYFTRAPNLTPAALRTVFGRFGSEHSTKLDAFLEQSRHDALSDLLSIRNTVAHGEEVGGAKLDPTRYIELCNDFYAWCLSEYLSD